MQLVLIEFPGPLRPASTSYGQASPSFYGCQKQIMEHMSCLACGLMILLSAYRWLEGTCANTLGLGYPQEGSAAQLETYQTQNFMLGTPG